MTGLLLVFALALPAPDTILVFSAPIPKDQIALRSALVKVRGVTGVGIDAPKGEIVVRVAGGQEKAVVKAVKAQGVRAQGAPRRTSPGGLDTLLVTPDGSAVGPLESLRVPGKFTVFDLFADWCGPCALVDQELHQILEGRNDVAVRKLNVQTFESPLSDELQLQALPYLVVFTPGGERKEIEGADLQELRNSLKAP